jgi:hypothetical protein
MGTISKRTFEELLNIEFKKFGLWTLLKNGSLGKKYNSIVWKHFKDFLVSENYFDSSDDITLFLILKIVRLNIFLWFYILIVECFTKSTKATKQEKKTKEKNVAV